MCMIWRNLTVQEGSKVVLQWQSVSNRLYTLEQCADLMVTGWTATVSNLLGQPPLNTCTANPSATPATYYRVGARPPF